MWKSLSARFPLPSADCSIWQFTINSSNQKFIQISTGVTACRSHRAAPQARKNHSKQLTMKKALLHILHNMHVGRPAIYGGSTLWLGVKANFFLIKQYLYINAMKEGEKMTQSELRELYRERLNHGKQCYIAEQTGINAAVLSQFKNEHIDLYPHLFVKLQDYLLNN